LDCINTLCGLADVQHGFINLFTCTVDKLNDVVHRKIQNEIKVLNFSREKSFWLFGNRELQYWETERLYVWCEPIYGP
jgi:hypothetical protein